MSVIHKLNCSAQSRSVMKQANVKLEKTLAGMKEIAEASDRIAKINRVTDGVAFQTNILAQNAAVETASAGEAEESAAASAELNGQANSLADIVRSLQARV